MTVPRCNGERVARDLRRLVAGDVIADRAIRALYATDASIYRLPPLCVVRVKRAEDAVAVVQYCAQRGIPLAPRGGGTGLAGECLTRGVVLDFHAHMRAQEAVRDGTVWVEPGVVPDELNRGLRAQGLLFGPDPATSDRCTIGGMVGINSTGAHSLVYGDTRRRVRALDVVLGDGTRRILQRTPRGEPGARTGLLHALADLATRARDIPLPFAGDLQRNRHGYLLWEAADREAVDPVQLVVGSEGTLAVVVRAQLMLDPVPEAKGLILAQFSDRIAPLRFVPQLLAHGPAALEFMDDVLLRIARGVPAYAAMLAPDVGSWLMAAFEGPPDEIMERLRAAERTCRGAPHLSSLEVACDPERQAFLTGMRQAAVPLLFRRADGYLPVPFIEDAAVPPARLGDYVAALEEIVAGHGFQVTCYGHAGPGELHIRPFMRPWEHAARMPAIARDVFALVKEYGGTVSGEHGDGLLRSFHVRAQYGEDLWRLFKAAKELFDPAGILNPGKKIVRDRELPVTDLRYGTGRGVYGIEVPSRELDLAADELARVAVACTGCGSCRSVKTTQRMCPVFRAVGLEEASPRAKAGVLREVATGALALEDGVAKVLDLCLWCTSCGHECPSGLSVPEAILELRARHARAQGLGLQKQAASMVGDLAALGSRFPRVFNFFQSRGWSRRVAQVLMGLDAQAPAPALARRRLVRNGVKQPPVPAPGTVPVAYFTDIYADLFAPELGRRVVALLERAGCTVVLPAQEPCGIVPLVYGKLDAARAVAARNVERLVPFVEAGYTLVASEPTAAMMLRAQYPRLVGADGPVSAVTWELGAFLHRRWLDGAYTPRLEGDAAQVAYHRPCHLVDHAPGDAGFVELLRDALGAALAPLPECCCGMSGTFGLRRAHRDLAARIARPVVDALRAGGWRAFASECASCRMQLERQSGVRAVHPAELLALE